MHFKHWQKEFPQVRQRSVLYEIPLAQRVGVRAPNTYEVVEADTFDVAQRLVEQKRNPLVLNMASDHQSGGGWLKGATAQEESLFYRSTYALTLDAYFGVTPNFYPLGRKGLVYSPYVLVFKDRDQRPLARPFAVSCAAVPGIRNPALVKGRLNPVDTMVTEQKVQALVDLALEHKHDTLLLSALGCGAFHNPPEHVAEIFHRVLHERQHGLHVVFAILSVHDRRNFLTFQRWFASATQ